MGRRRLLPPVRLPEHLVVDLSDRFDVQMIIAPQICGGVLRPIHRVAEATRQLRKLVLISGQCMSLQMMEDLESMLNRSKEDIGLRQRGMLLAGQVPSLRKALKGTERIGLSNPDVTHPIQDLERLRDKLDLAYTAVAQLDMTKAFSAKRDVRIDPILDGADLRDGAVVDRLAVDEGLNQLQEGPPHSPIPGHGPCLDERHALPGLPP